MKNKKNLEKSKIESGNENGEKYWPNSDCCLKSFIQNVKYLLHLLEYILHNTMHFFTFFITIPSATAICVLKKAHKMLEVHF